MCRGSFMFSQPPVLLELQDDTYIRTWQGWYQTVAYTLGYTGQITSRGGIHNLKIAENRRGALNNLWTNPLRSTHTYFSEEGEPKHGRKLTLYNMPWFGKLCVLCDISGGHVCSAGVPVYDTLSRQWHCGNQKCHRQAHKLKLLKSRYVVKCHLLLVFEHAPLLKCALGF